MVEMVHTISHRIARYLEKVGLVEAIDMNGKGSFLNARTDLFLKTPATEHSQSHLQDAITRAKAYEQAGADGIFAPGLVNLEFIERLCSAVEIPINIIPLPGCPSTSELAKAGVRRVSYGPLAYKRLMNELSENAKSVLSW